MSSDFFRFKQFCIRHDRCGMKVGTDGVLLGAWGDVGGTRILDIGTGTGLIALMAAQRNPDAIVVGIDIDEAAVCQANENVGGSPFCDRVGCELHDILTFSPKVSFDSILCNPPFFTEDTLPDNEPRALARNNRSLPFPKLIPKVAWLLKRKGKFSIIIPCEHVVEIVGLCLTSGLYLSRRCIVYTTARKPPRRTMLTFTKERGVPCDEQTLCLNADDGSRSQAYQELTQAFYLT